MTNLVVIIFLMLIPGYSSTESPASGVLKSETVYLHTDRNFYVAGDILYYKMYLKSEYSESSRFAYFIIRDEKSDVVSHSRLEVKDGVSFGSIKLADTLRTGFYQIVCFTNFMRNRPETIFRKEVIIANRFDDDVSYFTEKDWQTSGVNESSKIAKPRQLNLRILTDKSIYGRREEIIFTVEPGEMPVNEISSLSISVSQALDYSQPIPFITDFFSIDPQVQSLTDYNDSGFTYEMESDRSVIQGIVSETPGTVNKGIDFSSPQKSHTVFVSAIDTVPNLQYTTTDSSGKFCLYLNPWYEGKEIYLKLRSKANAQIILDSKFAMAEPFQPARDFNRHYVKEFIKRAVKTGQVARYYGSEAKTDTIDTFYSDHLPPEVYYKTYPKIYPSDYIELKDFFEISREIIPGIRIRKYDDSYSASFPSLKYQIVSDEEPLIFLDGVPIDNVGQIIELGSNDIEYIETVPDVRYFNGLYFNGILNVASKKDAIKNISFSQPFRQTQPDESLCFTKPEHFNPADLPSHYPDLRFVLFWEPEFRPTGSKMDFTVWSSDIQGDYVINVQGLTKSGLPVAGSAIITVQAK
jgi:hypothetical protein